MAAPTPQRTRPRPRRIRAHHRRRLTRHHRQPHLPPRQHPRPLQQPPAAASPSAQTQPAAPQEPQEPQEPQAPQAPQEPQEPPEQQEPTRTTGDHRHHRKPQDHRHTEHGTVATNCPGGSCNPSDVMTITLDRVLRMPTRTTYLGSATRLPAPTAPAPVKARGSGWRTTKHLHEQLLRVSANRTVLRVLGSDGARTRRSSVFTRSGYVRSVDIYNADANAPGNVTELRLERLTGSSGCSNSDVRARWHAHESGLWRAATSYYWEYW